MIDLYTAPTPNGHKASCTLEALNMDYAVHFVNISEGEQHTPDFLAKSPNGRIPAIVDSDFVDGNGEPLAIFESGAIMIHLAEKAGRLLPTDVMGRAKVIQWLMFQMGGIGPMMGQANVFHRYFPEKIQPVIDRYQNETLRLFTVLDKHLEQNEWLADDYSIADIANWCWVRTHNWSGVSIDGLENLQRWMSVMREQSGMQKGIVVPFDLAKQLKDKDEQKKFTDRAEKLLQK